MAILILYVIVIYNRLVNLKHDTAKAWSNIDVLLKQRHDELPKLVETCKRYMQYEQETLERVMQARAAVFKAPVLLLHGSDDTVVPYAQSTIMETALKAAGKPVRLVKLSKEDHWLSDSQTRLQTLKELDAFITQHIGQ